MNFKALLENPQALLRKMIRIGMYLVGILLVLIFLKYKHDQHEKEMALEEEKRVQEEQLKKVKEEVNWEDRLKTIVPDQEELLNPNVVPQILLPPLHSKIDVPKALVYERKKRYSNAYDVRGTPSVRMWNTSAVAAPLDVTTPLHRAMPELTRPVTSEAAKPRAPKPYRGSGQRYILLP